MSLLSAVLILYNGRKDHSATGNIEKTHTHRRSHPHSVYLKSSEIEAPSFIVTEAQSFHRTVTFILQHRELICMSYGWHTGWCIFTTEKQSVPLAQGRRLKPDQHWQVFDQTASLVRRWPSVWSVWETFSLSAQRLEAGGRLAFREELGF